MKKKHVLLLIIAAPLLLIAYALLTSPVNNEPSPAQTISTENYFKTLDYINATARRIWTKQIVGPAKKQGLKFGEKWLEKDVDEGPLPALFFRYTAKVLSKETSPKINLYLSSPNPINPSNLLRGESLKMFKQVEKSRQPVFKYLPSQGQYTGMFPDIASAPPCVSCHNDHKDTPKKDWKLNDVMGASVWILSQEKVSLSNYLQGIDDLVNAIATTYERFLQKTKTFKKQPMIGKKWPSEGYYLPTTKVFIAQVKEQFSNEVLNDILKLSSKNNNQGKK